MGRKSQAKQAKKSSGNETNKFHLQKRKELAVLVDKLLKLTSIFQVSTNLNKNWEHYLEIHEILNEVISIESSIREKSELKTRQSCVESCLKWLRDNGAQFDGVEFSEFEGYDLGLKATKLFNEGNLILTVPCKVMMSEKNARDSELSQVIKEDPLLQNMPNVTMALFLLLEKNNPESFWKPYIDILPERYSTILYFSTEELSELKPSPVFESSIKLYRSIARQYAYFYNKIYSLDRKYPGLKKLQDIFTFENYRWAVSSVMTRQNSIQLDKDADSTAFIPLWDMCNHEHGKITTDYNEDLARGECYAMRDFQPNEQIFIFYGARPNPDLFLHNGFVYPTNQHDCYYLALGVSSSDPLRDTKLQILNKLGLAGVSHFSLYQGDNPIGPELLVFIRVFNMNSDELAKWSNRNLPSELVSNDPPSSEAVGADIDRRAYTYLLTRCGLVKASYKDVQGEVDSLHRRNIKMLKKCEVQILDGAIKYLETVIRNLPTAK